MADNTQPATPSVWTREDIETMKQLATRLVDIGKQTYNVCAESRNLQVGTNELLATLVESFERELKKNVRVENGRKQEPEPEPEPQEDEEEEKGEDPKPPIVKWWYQKLPQKPQYYYNEQWYRDVQDIEPSRNKEVDGLAWEKRNTYAYLENGKHIYELAKLNENEAYKDMPMEVPPPKTGRMNENDRLYTPKKKTAKKRKIPPKKSATPSKKSLVTYDEEESV